MVDIWIVMRINFNGFDWNKTKRSTINVPVLVVLNLEFHHVYNVDLHAGKYNS
jgi:hypothetical protein